MSYSDHPPSDAPARGRNLRKHASSAALFHGLNGPPGRAPLLVVLLFTLLLLFAGAAPRPAMAGTVKEEARKIIIARGCVACHYIPGIPEAKGTLGPSLKNLKERPRFASGTLANTPENMRDWLKNPRELKPDTLMPDLGLSDKDIEILLQFFGIL